MVSVCVTRVYHGHNYPSTWQLGWKLELGVRWNELQVEVKHMSTGNLQGAG